METQVKKQVRTHRTWQGNLSLSPIAPSCAYDLANAFARMEGTNGG